MDPWQAFNFDWKLETNIDATKSMAGVVKKKREIGRKRGDLYKNKI